MRLATMEQSITKKSWIDFLYYKIARQSCNFRLCNTWIDNDGEIQFSKWRPYLDAQEDVQFIYRCNQREQLTCEVILDLDKGDYDELIKRVEAKGLKYWAYQTPSGRARHIHCIFPKLVSFSKNKRERFRELLIKQFGCDTAFKIDSHMVPIENCPHWKTGEMKLLYKTNISPEEVDSL